jgi:hypothetical protein
MHLLSHLLSRLHSLCTYSLSHRLTGRKCSGCCWRLHGRRPRPLPHHNILCRPSAADARAQAACMRALAMHHQCIYACCLRHPPAPQRPVGVSHPTLSVATGKDASVTVAPTERFIQCESCRMRRGCPCVLYALVCTVCRGLRCMLHWCALEGASRWTGGEPPTILNTDRLSVRDGGACNGSLQHQRAVCAPP